MNFAYDSSLDSNELRLLWPVSVNDRILHFRLLHVQRSPSTLFSYTAVSYTWGEGEASEVIYLNNRPFRVRPNLWSCLYYLSQAARDAAWSYLWVDAICINQADNTERSSQVRLMDQTYRDAVCVSVWLGLVPLPDYPLYIPPEMFPIKTAEIDNFDFGDSIVDLANRPYWSRVWTIQEFLLGRHVEIYCSDNCIEWMAFQDILSHKAGIEQFQGADHELVLTRKNQRSELPALSLVMGRHVDKHPKFLQPFYDLLVDHRDAQCKDPRDKVFGLLGLVTGEERAFLGRYFPDYAMSVDHVRIITLAHLTQFCALSRMERNREEISSDSEEVFAGLGVGAKAERRRLLERAESLDYLSGSVHAVLQFLTSGDLMEEYEGINPDFQEERMDSGSLKSCSRKWFSKSIGVISTLIVVWLIVKSAQASNFMKND